MNTAKTETAKDDITVLSDVEQLQFDVEQAELQFLDKLNNPDDITNVDVFSGLIFFIRQSVFDKIKQDNFKNPILENIALVSCAWDLYSSLCAKYHKTITVVQFSSMIDVSPQTLSLWASGNGRGVTKQCFQLAQKIYTACESATLNKTINANGIGAMFLLKSKFGYQEQSKQVIEVRNATQQTPDEIAARYADILPELESSNANLSDNLQAQRTPETSAFS